VTSGMSNSNEAFVGGSVSPVYIPLDDMMHACAEVCMSGGFPW
jgi:hypothetical protein